MRRASPRARSAGPTRDQSEAAAPGAALDEYVSSLRGARAPDGDGALQREIDTLASLIQSSSYRQGGNGNGVGASLLSVPLSTSSSASALAGRQGAAQTPAAVASAASIGTAARAGAGERAASTGAGTSAPVPPPPLTTATITAPSGATPAANPNSSRTPQQRQSELFLAQRFARYFMGRLLEHMRGRQASLNSLDASQLNVFNSYRRAIRDKLCELAEDRTDYHSFRRALRELFHRATDGAVPDLWGDFVRFCTAPRQAPAASTSGTAGSATGDAPAPVSRTEPPSADPVTSRTGMPAAVVGSEVTALPKTHPTPSGTRPGGASAERRSMPGSRPVPSANSLPYAQSLQGAREAGGVVGGASLASQRHAAAGAGPMIAIESAVSSTAARSAAAAAAGGGAGGASASSPGANQNRAQLRRPPRHQVPPGSTSKAAAAAAAGTQTREHDDDDEDNAANEPDGSAPSPGPEDTGNDDDDDVERLVKVDLERERALLEQENVVTAVVDAAPESFLLDQQALTARFLEALQRHGNLRAAKSCLALLSQAAETRLRQVLERTLQWTAARRQAYPRYALTLVVPESSVRRVLAQQRKKLLEERARKRYALNLPDEGENADTGVQLHHRRLALEQARQREKVQETNVALSGMLAALTAARRKRPVPTRTRPSTTDYERADANDGTTAEPDWESERRTKPRLAARQHASTAPEASAASSTLPRGMSAYSTIQLRDAIRALAADPLARKSRLLERWAMRIQKNVSNV